MKRVYGIVVMGIALSTAIVTTAEGSTAKGFGSDSPATIIQLAEHAVEHAGSVTVALSQKIPAVGLTVSQNVTSTTTSGQQTVNIHPGTSIVRNIGGTLYFWGDRNIYQYNWNDPKSPTVGKWVLIPKSLVEYSALSTGILLSSVVKSLLQMKNLTNKGATTYKGHAVVDIQGQLTYATSGAKIIQQTYISTGSTALTFGASDAISASGVKGTGTTMLTKYGSTASVAAPSSYVTATAKDF